MAYWIWLNAKSIFPASVHQFYANILVFVNINPFLYLNHQFALFDTSSFSPSLRISDLIGHVYQLIENNHKATFIWYSMLIWYSRIIIMDWNYFKRTILIFRHLLESVQFSKCISRFECFKTVSWKGIFMCLNKNDPVEYFHSIVLGSLILINPYI